MLQYFEKCSLLNSSASGVPVLLEASGPTFSCPSDDESVAESSNCLYKSPV